MKISIETEIIDDCIICAHESTITADERFARLLGLIPPYRVQRCERCNLRWLSPRPTAQAYEELYAYQNYFDGADSVEHYPNLARERTHYFLQRIKRIENLFADKQLKLLDVGAATGEFTYIAVSRGHNAMGIELSSGARSQAKANLGVDLEGTPLEEVKPEQSFDVIHMNHVLEHLPDPRVALETCHRLLKSGGLLVIEVPQQLDNDLDRLKKVLGLQKKPEFNAYSLHHTYFFDPKNISALFKACGFMVQEITTANPERTPLRPFTIKNFILRYYLALSDLIHKGGNIIEVYARKK